MKKTKTPRKKVRGKNMKRLFACLLGLWMVPIGTGGSLISISTKQVKAANESQQVKDQEVSFDQDSLNTKIGYFKEYKLKGISKDDVRKVEFSYSNKDILTMETPKDYTKYYESYDPLTYVPVAKNIGTTEVTATITTNEGTITTKPTKFTVTSKDADAIPLKSYKIFRYFSGYCYDYDNEDEESVYINTDSNDEEISNQEIKHLDRIILCDYNLNDEDLSGLDYAKDSCKKIDLSGNKNITNISFMKDFKLLKSVKLNGTSVTNIDVLKNKEGLKNLNLSGLNIKTQDRYDCLKEISLELDIEAINSIRPSGVLNSEDKVTAEDTNVLKVEETDGDLCVTAMKIPEEGYSYLNVTNDGVTHKIKVEINGKNENPPRLKKQQEKTNLSCFKNIEFQNTDDSMDITISSNKPEILDVKDDRIGNFYLEPKSEGIAELTARIQTEDGYVYISKMNVEVGPLKEGIIPLKSYYVYDGLAIEGGENVDENKDGSISTEEIKRATNLYMENDDLKDEDLQGIEQAVNCEELWIYGNPDITNINFVKKMSKLKNISLEGTNVKDFTPLNGVLRQLERLYFPEFVTTEQRFSYIPEYVYLKPRERSLYWITRGILNGNEDKVTLDKDGIVDLEFDTEGDNYIVTAKEGQEGNFVNATITNGNLKKIVKLVVTKEDGTVDLKGISINKEQLFMTLGKTEQLKVSYNPEYATIHDAKWKSSDDSVVSVNENGEITAKKIGTAKITASTEDGKIAVCMVTVTEAPTEPTKPEDPKPTPTQPTTAAPQKVAKITVTAPSNKLSAGKKVKLTANISNNASNKNIKWTTSNKKYATVDKNGVVKFNKKAAGKTVTITAYATDGSGKKATFKIKIMKGTVKKIKITGKKTVKAGKTLSLKAKVTASKGANKKLKWTSSNTKYATVSGSGKVKALKAGKKKSVKITAMATDGSGKKATVTIKIK